MTARTNHIHLTDTKIPLHRGYSHSVKLVCFKCRICFHKPYYAGVFQCGTCKAPTTYAGTAFRAPRKTNKKEWAKLEVLIKAGVTFQYYGGTGVLPATARAARLLLKDKRR